MRYVARTVSAVFAVAFLSFVGTSAALACACCSDTAQRNVRNEKFNALRMGIMVQTQLAPEATLLLSDTEEEPAKGIGSKATDYKVSLEWKKGDIAVFTFHDDKNQTGTLTLVPPKTISIFEVDTRESATADTGLGPVLYKEWKMTSPAAGDGIFKGAVGKGQQMTLVFHGRGRSCPDANQFHAWTLLVYGPSASFTLYGKLEQEAQ